MSSGNKSDKHATSKSPKKHQGSRAKAATGKVSGGSSSAAQNGAAGASSHPRSSKSKKDGSASRVDQRTKNDILGVLVAVMAIALFISVVAPTSAVLASYTRTVLDYGLGIGAYVIPIILFVWGISFFARSEQNNVWRTGIGLLLLLVALLATTSLSAPGIEENPSALFEHDALVSHGGYIGAGLAWVLVKLVGRTIGFVILVGIALAGAIVLGFSISRIVERSRARLSRDADSASDGLTSRIRLPRRLRGSRSQSDARVIDGYAPTDVLQTEQMRGLDQYQDPADDMATSPTLSLDREDRTPDRKRRRTKTQKTQIMPVEAIGGESNPSALEGFDLPPMSILHTSGADSAKNRQAQSVLRETATHLQQTLQDFRLDAKVRGWVSGPTFTMFKVEMPAGIRLTKITGLQNDIALALAAEAVRIFAPIPGTSLVGIEIPNKVRSNVLLGDVLKTVGGGPLQISIGKDVEGEAISADLARMPHLLIGGTTGSGKSVAINSMIISMLMRATPAEVRMILIDPKRVELSVYNGIPHLYVPVVTDPREASSVLAWATIEMDRRLKLFENAGARDIGIYNAKVQSGELEDADELPYMVIVIDELSDLMMVAGKEVEGSIIRIAQLARAAGIHLIVATQRPSSNVVTGMIKANIVNRIAFKVATSIESRVILDQNGAEKLIGYGDLLFLSSGSSKPKRIQGCFVSDEERQQIVDALKQQGEPDYHDEILSTPMVDGAPVGKGFSDVGSEDDDPLLWEAAALVVSTQLGSTSSIQRRLKVGYARAGRIMDQLYEKGVVGPPDGSKPRDVLIQDELELETVRSAGGRYAEVQ